MFRMIATSFAALIRTLRGAIALHPAVLSFSPPDDRPGYQVERAY
ncbi:hypothetical protein [Oscillochloris sp. ZM17-4]|nr:hypothetical protein [Oscillochloris sp. ZM17-4]